MNVVDSYIEKFPIEVQGRLTAIREAVKEIAPQATERICMRIPTFDLYGKWFIHYAGFEQHIGFYPQPEGIEAFKDALKGYKTTKGGVQFPLDKELPLELIKEIITFKLKDQERYINEK